MEALTFGEQVKIILGRKGMTIKELAETIEERTGKKMSRQNLTQRLGRDNFQEQDMRMIADILGCPFHLSILSGETAGERGMTEKGMTEKGMIAGAAATAGTAGHERRELYKSAPKEGDRADERDMTIGELYKLHEELSELEEAKRHSLLAVEEAAVRSQKSAKLFGKITGSQKTEPSEQENARQEQVKPGQYKTGQEQVEVRPGQHKTEQEQEEQVKPGQYKAGQEQAEQVEQVKPGQYKTEQEQAEQVEPGQDKTGQEQAEQVKPGQYKTGQEQAEQLKSRQDKTGQEQQERVRTWQEKSAYENPEQERFDRTDFEETETTIEFPKDLGDFEPVIKHDDLEENLELGDVNPYTGREFQTNSVRMHPSRIGYVQVYDRSTHRWTDMTEWAFLGYQERKKALLGKNYEPPIYLD